MVKTCSIHGQTLIFMVKIDSFCAQILQVFLVSLHSIPMTKFHVPFQWQNFMFHSNDTISCSKPIPFQCQNFMLNPIPLIFQQNSKVTRVQSQFTVNLDLRSGIAILEASHAFLLTCSVFQQFEPSLGTATKAILHQWSRVTRQVSWVLEQVKQVHLFLGWF